MLRVDEVPEVKLLPEYRPRSSVRAAKIESITPYRPPGTQAEQYRLTLKGEHSRDVPTFWLLRYADGASRDEMIRQLTGGYYVVDEGHGSWMAADDFERRFVAI